MQTKAELHPIFREIVNAFQIGSAAKQTEVTRKPTEEELREIFAVLTPERKDDASNS